MLQDIKRKKELVRELYDKIGKLKAIGEEGIIKLNVDARRLMLEVRSR